MTLRESQAGIFVRQVAERERLCSTARLLIGIVLLSR